MYKTRAHHGILRIATPGVHLQQPKTASNCLNQPKTDSKQAETVQTIPKTAPTQPKSLGISQNLVKWTPDVVIRSVHHDRPFLTPTGRCLPLGVAFCVFPTNWAL